MTSTSRKTGIMQGRLVPPVGTRIQAFPVEDWRKEFAFGREAGLQTIEWIYDTEGDDINPIATDEGIREMADLGKTTDVAVKSLCADYFMTHLLLIGTAQERETREAKLHWLLGRCKKAGIGRVVLPFVDSSDITTDAMFADLVSLLKNTRQAAADNGVELNLETALGPARFAALLDAIGDGSVKVNYDTGNSASLRYDVGEEFAAYGSLIGSIHIKDRIAGGTTVPLGKGNADFRKFATSLGKIDYKGDFILQVARGESGAEVPWAVHNRNYLAGILAGTH